MIKKRKLSAFRKLMDESATETAKELGDSAWIYADTLSDLALALESM
jgi:hypothetical protein